MLLRKAGDPVARNRNHSKRQQALTKVTQRGAFIAGGWFFMLTIVIALAVAKPVHASDELSLTGIVKSIDQTSGIVYVDVISQSCPGLKQFKVDDVEALEGYHIYIDRKLSFTIDSSICNDGQIHTMLISRRGRK